MLRPAVLVAAAALFAACGGTPTPPPPTRVEISSHPAEHQPPPRDAHNPFRRADRDPPPPRSEPQLPPAELDQALAAAAAARAAGDNVEVTQALLPCANKIPKSTRCEGELALVLAKSPGHRAESDYYLKHAIADDDPAADADFYGRLAEALRVAPMLPEAAVALQRRIARLPEPTAADWAALAEVLQGVPRREAEAAEALQRAFERDPSQLKYLRDAGELLSQVPGRGAEALVILERYRDSIRTTEPEALPALDRRIAQVRAETGQPAASTAPAQGKSAKPGTPK
ncbi:tetratricopeptide repeat protein [Nannocystis pusilla]|uniref:tetratricopeptide repeat protein n=1 Tax=Nannocystis pusilla TaxID=889268 RepID=UPI003DA2DC07